MKFLKNNFWYILSLGLLLSCSPNNSLDLNLGPEILSLKPNGSATSFASNSGDTISLALIRNDHSVEEISEKGEIGNLDYELLKVETRWYQTQSDTPYYQFNYNFRTSLSNNTKGQVDYLSISFEDSTGLKAESLDIIYNEEGFLLDPNLLIYYDSLTLVNKVFYEVFSPLNSAADSKQFFFTGQQGIVGFVSGGNSNEVFERIN